MASLRKKSGHYYARFYDSNRSPKQKELALKTTRKDNARKKLVKWEEGYEEGEFDPWNGGWQRRHETVEDSVEKYMEAKRREGLQESTLDGYEYKLNNFLRHTPAGAMMRDVQPDHIRSYLHACVNEGQANESAPSNARSGAATATSGRSSRGQRRTSSWTIARWSRCPSPGGIRGSNR